MSTPPTDNDIPSNIQAASSVLEVEAPVAAPIETTSSDHPPEIQEQLVGEPVLEVDAGEETTGRALGSEPTESEDVENDDGGAVDALAAAEAASDFDADRPLTPLSRQSTPALGVSSSTAARKFSSVNVNKKFLNKSVGPPGSGSTKDQKNSPALAASTIAAPVSTRLLSTKLTTVPSTISSTSPIPPTTGMPSSAGSPWAKTAPLKPSDGLADGQPGLGEGHDRYQLPVKARLLTSTPKVAMGSGQGIASTMPRLAWKAVSADQKKPLGGMARDFPTAREVAEGKRAAETAAETAAQAQAAHNQAILQGLNAFTHMDANAHRWEDEEDDDDVIDFGGQPISSLGPGGRLIRPVSPHDAPVHKSERFVEDFDRSWPRQRPAPRDPSTITMPEPPIRTDSGRVLFNASSNRLEPPSARPAALPIVPRIAQRPESLPPNRSFDRPLPPHLLTTPAEGGRMLPPHMTALPETSTRPRVEPPIAQPVRNLPSVADTSISARPTRGWGELPKVQPAPPPVRPEPTLPPAPVPTAPVLQSPTASTSAPVDDQTAEMHTAAEKARLRRLAEEKEREAAAERARRKAKELEERFGVKPKEAAAATPAPAPKQEPAPIVTLMQRPQPAKPAASVPSRPAGAIPARPPAITQDEGSWRRGPAQPITTEASSPAVPPKQPEAAKAAPIAVAEREVPTPLIPVKPVLSPSQEPLHPPGKTTFFDSTLARIQAAMSAARTDPKDEATIRGPSAAELPRNPADHPSRSRAAVTPPQPDLVPTFFDVTQGPLPKSPPPAWRTFAVKLPSSPVPRPNIPAFRLKNFGQNSAAPSGWTMTFVPPLGAPHQLRADLLLPSLASNSRSAFRSSPPVKLPTEQFVPFVRKPKRMAPREGSRKQAQQPPVDIDSLLPAHVEPKRRDIPTKAEQVIEPEMTITAKELEKKRPSIAPTGSDKRERSLSELKPGVRFMVSSEMEGDSLLDEVNKMSLETLRVGPEERPEAIEEHEPRPTTPPHAVKPSATSPSHTATPWSNSSTTTHEHLKNVWSNPSSATGPSRRLPAINGTQSAQDTPVYPSLNDPSSASLTAEPSSSSSANPTVPSQSPANDLANPRELASQYGYGATYQQNLLGYQRASLANAMNGTYEQNYNVWSPSAFGAGYGYSKPAGASSHATHGSHGSHGSHGPHNARAEEYRYQSFQGQAGFQNANTTYGQTQYPNRHHVTSPPSQMYGSYGYGSGQWSAPKGRFAGAGATEGGYYGGVERAAYGYEGSHTSHGVIGQQGRSAGAGAAAGGSGSVKKMWG